MLILFPSIRDLEKLLKKTSKYKSIFFSILTSESENIGFLHVCMYVLNKRINTLGQFRIEVNLVVKNEN